MSGYLVFAVAATIVIGANAFVSYTVGGSEFYDTRQKAVQIALVWLLPVLGMLLVGGILWSNYERPSASRDHPEHRIPDFVGANDRPDGYHHGGV